MSDLPRDAANEPPSRSTILLGALGGVGTLVLIALILFRVLGGVNQAVNKANDEERERQERMQRQLAGIGIGKPADPDPTRDRALRDIENADPALRLESVDVLGRLYLDDLRAVAHLAKRVVEDTDPRVRLAAVRALGKVKPRPKQVETILDSVTENDDDPRVRAEAAAALAKGKE